MAMSCVAENTAKRHSRNHSPPPTCEGFKARMVAIPTARRTWQANTQLRRCPHRSSAGAQRNFSVHGKPMRLSMPMSARRTPCTRKYTGNASLRMPKGKPSAKYRIATQYSFVLVVT